MEIEELIEGLLNKLSEKKEKPYLFKIFKELKKVNLNSEEQIKEFIENTDHLGD